MRSGPVGVYLLARDEADYIRDSIDGLRRALRATGLSTGAQLCVVDGGSTDGTDALATAAGVRVIRAAEIAAELGGVLGKGDSLWRAASVAEEETLLFLDADLDIDWSALVEGLLDTLATRAGTRLVKASFVRLSGPRGRPDSQPTAGGRVTTEVVRPFLAEHLPWLASLREPLSGQIAVRREVLRSLPVLTGYGLEAGMLLDVVGRCGLAAVAEVDVGEVYNPPQPAAGLVQMAADVQAALVDRSITYGWLAADFAPPAAVPVERPPLGP